jgi:hypothetical protein
VQNVAIPSINCDTWMGSMSCEISNEDGIIASAFQILSVDALFCRESRTAFRDSRDVRFGLRWRPAAA